MEKHENAFTELKKNSELRSELVSLLLKFEEKVKISDPTYNVRDLITGPIIDLMFAPEEVIEKQLKDGTIFRFRNRSKITRDFIMSNPPVTDHVWEPQTTRLLKLLAADAKNIIIGGAYIGDHAILLAKEITPSNGIVHAFEPDMTSREMLMLNTKLNNLENISINEKCLWSQSNHLFQLNNADAISNVVSIEDDVVSSVVSISIDDYCSEIGIKNIDLIMIDVEGAEFEALKGTKSLFESSHGILPNIVFEIHSQYVDWSQGIENTELCEYLSRLGYSLYAIRDFHSNYNASAYDIEIIPIATCYLEGPPHGFNVLAIRDSEIINKFNLKIVKYVSPKLLLNKDPQYHHPISDEKLI